MIFEEIEKGEEEECTEKNLTERFWVITKDENEKIKEVNEEINQYFVTIDNVESSIDDAFKEYYAKVKGEGEGMIDMVIKEIIKECCGKENGENLHLKFLANLEKLCDNDENLKENKKTILPTIKKRITLNNKITEGDLKSFIKQKIGIKEKKEEKKKQEGWCPCCDC